MNTYLVRVYAVYKHASIPWRAVVECHTREQAALIGTKGCEVMFPEAQKYEIIDIHTGATGIRDY